MAYTIKKIDITNNIDTYSFLLERMYKEESLLSIKNKWYVKFQEKLKLYKNIVDLRVSSLNLDNCEMFELIEEDSFCKILNGLNKKPESNYNKKSMFLIVNLPGNRIHIPEILVINDSILGTEEYEIYNYIVNYIELYANEKNISEVSYEYYDKNKNIIYILEKQKYKFLQDDVDLITNTHIATKKINCKDEINEEGYNCTRQRKKSDK